MRRRIVGIVLAIVLCLGLAVPNVAIADSLEPTTLTRLTVELSDPHGQSPVTVTMTEVYSRFNLDRGGFTAYFTPNGTISFSTDFLGVLGDNLDDYEDVFFQANTEYTLSDFGQPIRVWFINGENADAARLRSPEQIDIVGVFTFSSNTDYLQDFWSSMIDFIDLSTASAWAHEGITNAIELGLVPQNLQSDYTQATTRAEFTALAVALYETVMEREITGRVTFNDTNDVNVQKMAYLGVVTGVGDDNFAPNNQLTREQAATMLSRLMAAMDSPRPDVAPTFADNASISEWAFEAVGHMQATGIMGGVGNNNFDPHGDYTREQSIITILRLFDVFD
jgi:hypothetical protein